MCLRLHAWSNILLAQYSFLEAGVKVHGSKVTYLCRTKFNTGGGMNYGMPMIEIGQYYHDTS